MPSVKIALAKAALLCLVAADIPVMMSGAPGVGKSDLGRDVAGRLFSGRMIDFRAALRDSVALMGIPSERDGLTHWSIPEELPDAARHGEDGLLFLDEINAAAPSVQVGLFGLVLDRKLNAYDMRERAPGWRIIAAGNRIADKAAAQRMPSALANRFAHLTVEPSLDDWCNWANGGTVDEIEIPAAYLEELRRRALAPVHIPPVLIAFHRFREADGLLHKMPDSPDQLAFPTPRSWASVAKIWDAPASVRQTLVASLVGDGAAAEFEGFIRFWTAIPSLADIAANPESAPVPEEPATVYAVTAALSRKAERSNFGAFMTYMARLPVEFRITFALDVTNRVPALKDTAAYVKWAAENQHAIN